MKPTERDCHVLDVMLRLIGRLQERTEMIDKDRFVLDPNEVDLTALRLAARAEQGRKLSEELKLRYPDVPWRKMTGLRNVVSHDYEAIDPGRVWEAARLELAPIARAELARFD